MDWNTAIWDFNGREPISSILRSGLRGSISAPVMTYESGFKELLMKITGGNMAEEIRKNYNVTLDVRLSEDYQELVDSGVAGCTNYVRISPKTLSEMEKNPALKRKVEKAIKEFCSSKEQAGIKALRPPVESAGMLIKPDGSTFYWLKGYSNEKSKNREDRKTNIEKRFLSQRNHEETTRVRDAYYAQLFSYLTGNGSVGSLTAMAAYNKSRTWRNKNSISAH